MLCSALVLTTLARCSDNSTNSNSSALSIYPEKFGFKIKKLSDKIDLIIRNIGYKPAKFETAVLRKPHVLTEVFPKIIDRRKGLNVQA